MQKQLLHKSLRRVCRYSLNCLLLCSVEAALAAGEPSNVEANEPGIVVTGRVEPAPGIASVAKQLTETQNSTKELRSKIIGIQDVLAGRFRNTRRLVLSLATAEPNSEKDSLAFVETSVSLNGVDVLVAARPRSWDSPGQFQVFDGPLPLGEYEIKVRLVIGLLQYGVPHLLSQGRWYVERALALALPLENGDLVARLMLKRAEPQPEIVLETENVTQVKREKLP